MSLRAFVLACLTSLLATIPASLQATQSGLDSAFVTEISPGLTPTSYPTFDSGTGAVNAVALQSDGKILAGGNVSRYKTGGDLTALKRLLATGAPDGSFNSGGAGLAASGGQAEVNALLVDASDRIYVGGTFTSYNGVSRSGILRLLADGTLDTAYAPVGLNGTVRFAQALALQADGKLLVGGGFTTINGTFRRHLARLDTDGSLDTSFDPNSALDLAGSVGDIAVQPDGKILVGGSRNLGNFQSGQLLVRLNADGSLDSSFNPALATAVPGQNVQRLLLLPDGRLVISGFLTLAPSGTETYIACLLPNGDLDTAFQANIGDGPDGWAGGDLVLQPDGTLLASGIFTLWNGQPRASVARLNQDGTLDPTFAPAPYDERDGGYLTHFYSLAVQPDGKLVAGGWFSRVTDPALETYNLTRFVNEFSAASPGSLRLLSATANTAENAGSITLRVSRFGGLAGAVSVNYAASTGGANGTATAGSDFTTTNGTLSWAADEGGFKTITIPINQDAAAESPETFTVTLSAPTGGATVPTANAKTVVTIRDDDSAPLVTRHPAATSLEQGANFSLSVAYDSVLPVTIRWQRDPDGAGPLPFADLAASGTVSGVASTTLSVITADPATHAGAYRAVLSSTAGTTNSNPAAVAISVPAGSVDVTGFVSNSASAFTKAVPLGDGRYLAITNTGLVRLNATGALDTTFAAVSFNNSASDLLIQTDGKIIVGGFFTSVTVNTVATSRNGVARFNADGTLDTAYNLNLTHSVQSLASGAGGKLYVGGTSGGGFKRFTSAGILDTTFGVNGVAANIGTGNPNGYVWQIQELADGRILVAHTVGSGFSSSYRLQILTAAGAIDPAFNVPTLNWNVTGWDFLPDGRLAVVGRFSQLDGKTVNSLVILNADGSVDPTFQSVTNASTLYGVRYHQGRLFVWGTFTTTAGAAPANLARFNLDGSLDTSFSIGAGANGTVTSLHVTAAGDFDIFGSFSQFKGVARSFAARLVGNSHIGAIGFAPPRATAIESVDLLFLALRRYGPATEPASIQYATADASATAGADYAAASGTVSWAAGDSADKTISIQLLDDDAVESTETFRVVLSNPSGPVTAAASATVTLLDDDTPATFTTQPSGPGSTLFTGDALNLSGAVVSSPTPVAYQWFLNGVAIPGATSASFAKTPASLADAGLYTLVATNAAGALPANIVHVVIAPQPGRVAPGQAAGGRPSFTSGGVQTVLALPDGGALVGGFFGANPTFNIPKGYLLRVKADGTTDTSFTLDLGNNVRELIAQPDGKILIAGDFTFVNGVTQRYLYRLNADLTPDTAFNSAVATAIGQFFGLPSSIALDSTGRIYLGFNNSSTGSVWRFSSAGVLDDAYTLSTSTVSFTGGGVTALAMQSGDRLLVGGNFTDIGPFSGSSVSKNRLARITPEGAVDTGFTASLGTLPINDLLVTSTGRVFVAGGTGGGNTNLVEVSATDGSTQTGGSSGNQIYEVAYGPDGRLALARAAISGSGAISRLNVPVGATTSNDTSFNVGTGPNADVFSLAYTVDGSLWLAGQFTTFNGFASGGIVKLQGSAGDPGIVNPPARADANAGATASFAVGAVGTNLSYQWFKNGVALVDDARISGATTAVLSISGLTASDDDTYTVEVTGGTPSTTVESAPAKLNVLGAPTVAVSPASVAPALGSTVTLAADVLAATPATYVWKRDGVAIVNGGRYSGATTGTLVITGANSTDNGAYTLTVTNSQGSVSTTPATVTAGAFVAGARDDATARVRALNTSTQLNAILHLPDGRTLIGGTAGSAGGGVLDSAGTTISTGLVIADQTGSLASTPAGGFTRQVNVVIPLPGGKFLVAGTFSTVNGGSAVNAVRLNADLTRDTAFAPASTNIAFTAAHGDAQGRVYLAGSFTNYNGQTGYNHLVRLKPDGALDTDFNPALNGAVNCIRTLPDGRFYVGGAFTTANAVPALNILRFLPDGRPDASFDAASASIGAISAIDVDPLGRLVVGGATGVRRLLPDGSLDSTFSIAVNNTVRALLALPDGKTLVGGAFTSPTNRFFRLDADGARDTAFDVGTGFGASGSVNAIATDSIGRVWLGGQGFTTYKGVASSAAGFAILQSEAPATLGFTRLPTAAQVNFGETLVLSAAAIGNNGFTYRWLKNGTPLSDGPGVSGSSTANLTLSGLAADDAGAYSVRIAIPGGATLVSPASPLAVGPVVVPPVITTPPPAEFSADLGGNVTLTAVVKGALPLTYRWFHFATPLSDGSGVSGATTASLTLGGLTFDRAGEYTLRVTNPDGMAETEPTLLTVEKRPGALAAGSLGTVSANSSVLAILRLADGSMLVGGQFTSITVNGVANNRSRLARFLADGTLDPSFTPSIPSTVRAIAQDSAGRVFVGGDFNGSLTVGGVTANRIRVARLTSALVLDTAFDTSAAGPNGGSNSVLALAPVGDGSVYVGGRFTQIGAVTAGVNRMAKLNASGALDASGFTSYATGDVNTILRLPNGTLYVGGASNFWNTPSLPGSPAGRLVKLNANGSTRDTAFASPDVFTIVNQVIRLADGTLFVAGNSGLPYLRRINAATGADASDPAYAVAGHLSQVNAIAQQADGKLLSGALGTFKRTDLAGTADAGFGAFNSTISALAVDASGRIWVGGSFNQYNGAAQSNLAVLTGGDYESRDGLLTPQTLTFPAIADRTFGDNGNTLSLPAVTSDRGLMPITFSVTGGPATVSGNTLTITGAGSITVEASQAGDATYAAATASRTFTVAKAAQTIGFADPADRTIASPAFELSATASSGLPVSFEVSGVATLGGDGKTVTLAGTVGTVTVTARQAGDANYHAAPDVVQTFEVTTGTPQTITFNALQNRVVGAKFTLAATASSGLPVAFEIVDGDATLGTDGKTVTVGDTAGSVTIRATQDGGEKGGVTYAPAEPVEQSFEVTLGPPTQTQKITFNQPAAATYGDDPIELVATASSDLPVSFELVSTAPAGIATLDDGTLTILGAGKVTVRAVQPGSYPFKPAAAVTRTITINKADLAVSFESVSRLVREPNPAFTPVYSGFVNGDTEADLAATRPVGITSAKPASSAGEYPIALKGGLDANYRFVPGEPAFLTVQGFGGAYEALLVDADGTPRGKLELTVSTNALAYTGVLNLASEPVALSLRGALSATDGSSATGAWSRTTDGVAALDLGFELVGDTLDGELSRNGEAALSIGSGSRVYVQTLEGKKKLPSPWTGAHTLVLRDPTPLAESDARALPLGSGTASASVAATGVMSLKGKLADGTVLTGSARPAALAEDAEESDGHYRLFLRPYAKRLDSFLAGEPVLVPHPDQDRFAGRYWLPEGDTFFVWAKAALPESTPAKKQDKACRAGFELETVAFLDPWLAPSAKAAGAVPAGTLAQRLSLAASPADGATVEVAFALAEGYDFGARADFLPGSLTLSAKGGFTVPLPPPAKADNPAFSLKVTPATGAFTGSFILSDVPEGKTKAVARKVAISGTLRQGPDGSATLGHAHFLLDPSVDDTDTEQISGELILTAPTGSE